ncbi:MAG: NADH-quinone oxidoreductase [Candidatus Iainarchaeum archaeon]|uniref:NADH-quinone oxidoreductase n=1 Tax=Candidatus Iainarchaeum sp. TaxID=3101447 RepID=A0A497JFW2_9ARCH|nr:MAG: NADH-quinone oxidoreductase [Candidatus Diapherotrites archaeon]
MLSLAKQLIKQLFKKPETNPFPSKRVPKSVIKFMKKVKKGEAKINEPVKTPPRFRGRLIYYEDKCIRCKQCIRVCPANALEFDEKNNVIKHYVSRCTFCGQCVEICPVKALEQSNEFLLADYNKNAGFLEPKEKEVEKG